MRPLPFLLLAIAPFYAHAGDRARELAAASGDYVNGDFKKAATRFAVLCNRNDDAEACYWAGLSYERLADERIPFGCTADTQAHRYFARATRLMPDAPVYRDALFDFLLGASDCSPTALGEAARVLAATPKSDPAYREMSRRLEDERHYNASAAARLSKLCLIVPRATYRIAGLPGSISSGRKSYREAVAYASGSAPQPKAPPQDHAGN
jgi:hypothetical protein